MWILQDSMFIKFTYIKLSGIVNAMESQTKFKMIDLFGELSEYTSSKLKMVRCEEIYPERKNTKDRQKHD